jgi:hypothetical protein
MVVLSLLRVVRRAQAFDAVWSVVASFLVAAPWLWFLLDLCAGVRRHYLYFAWETAA